MTAVCVEEECTVTPVPEDGPCDDLDDLTRNDRCIRGICRGEFTQPTIRTEKNHVVIQGEDVLFHTKDFKQHSVANISDSIAQEVQDRMSEAAQDRQDTQDALNDLDAKIDQAKMDLDQAIVDLENEQTGNLNTAKTDLETEIDDVENRLDTAYKAADRQLRSDFETADSDLTDTIDQAKIALQGNMDTLSAELGGALDKVEDCTTAGQAWDSDSGSCVAVNPHVASGGVCNSDRLGSMKYEGKLLQVCDGTEWRAVKPDPLGSESNPAASCEAIEHAGDVDGDGWYYIARTDGMPAQQRFCQFNLGWSVDFGSFKHGDITITSSRTIEQLFNGYDPRNGIYPEWRDVRIVNGATLSTGSYNPATNKGGLIAFKARSVSICSNCKIDASGRGHSGGLDIWTRTGYPSNVRGQGGFGPGGGIGGRGGSGAFHGGGGGGGSFAGPGTEGTPDECRQSSDRSAQPGQTYGFGSRGWDISPPMGSGGAAGGPGHPSTSANSPRPGSRGGGAIQIAAETFQNDGMVLSNGVDGSPQTNFQNWPNGNPQVGSGGGGSGGLVKIIAGGTGRSYLGKAFAAGGKKPIRQNWGCGTGGRTNRVTGQQGGRGGVGHIVFTQLSNSNACGSNCQLGSSAHPAPTCQHLKDAGINADGVYWIGTGSQESAKWFCELSGDHAAGYSYGSGVHGDLNLLANRDYFIEDLFPGYDPRRGRIPMYKSVNIRNGARLKCRAWDGFTGGMIAFMVQNALVIDSSSRIDASETGHEGARDMWRNSGYRVGAFGLTGSGPGGGKGGIGGNRAAHGHGGGGGSFMGPGGTGTIDDCRGIAARYSEPGDIYRPKHMTYFVNEEVMGSGGGAGGPGHPSSANCPAEAGGNGGGTVQIMARATSISGNIFANGGQGFPRGPTCNWLMNGNNPQAGSGGGGSGGVVKLISTNLKPANSRLHANGGGEPVTQGWCRSYMQRGGSGGIGVYSHFRANPPV